MPTGYYYTLPTHDYYMPGRWTYDTRTTIPSYFDFTLRDLFSNCDSDENKLSDGVEDSEEQPNDELDEFLSSFKVV